MVPLLLITKTPGRPSQVFGPANICAIVEYLKYDVYASGGTRDLSRRLALMTPIPLTPAFSVGEAAVAGAQPHRRGPMSIMI
jgi:hypothetical protein